MALHGDAKRKYQREWLAKRRQDWINSQGGVCENCGSSEMLEVDHIDPSKKTMHTSSIWGRSEHIRNAELQNCQVLCETCHYIKTLGHKPGDSHGSLRTYTRYKCRCVLCTEANAENSRKYRKQKKSVS